MPAERPRLSVVEGGTAVPGRAAAGLELAALGTGLVLTAVLLARLPSWRAELGAFQSLLAVAFAFCAAPLLAFSRFRDAPHAALTVFAVALAARLALLPVVPSLSDDIYRYVWEGRVAAHGADPYRVSPLDPSLAELRDRDVFPRINHPELATIYPPLSMAGFALVAAISPTVWAMKAWVILHDLALVLVMVRWLRRRGESPVAAIAYAWNPLVLVEYAGSGHNDPTAMLWLVLALTWAERRPVASAAALAAGALTKLAPLAALPFLLPRWPWRARVLAALLLGVGFGWYWIETRGADSGLTAYWRTWRNNDLAFHYLARWMASAETARRIALGLVAAAIALALGRRWSAPRGTSAALRTGLLVSPVAHPWYFGWALVLEPLAQASRARILPWLLLSLTCVLSYGLFTPPPEGRDFHLPLAWRWIEYGAPLALAVAFALPARTVRATPRVPPVR